MNRKTINQIEWVLIIAGLFTYGSTAIIGLFICEILKSQLDDEEREAAILAPVHNEFNPSPLAAEAMRQGKLKYEARKAARLAASK